MGISLRNENLDWSICSVRYLTMYYPTYGKRGMEMALGRSWKAIQNKASELDIRRTGKLVCRQRLLPAGRKEVEDGLRGGLHPCEVALELCVPYFLVCNIRTSLNGGGRESRTTTITRKPGFWERVKQRLLGQREVW